MSRKIVVVCFYLIAIFALIVLFAFFAYVFYKGINTLSLKLIFDDVSPLHAILGKERVFDGIFNAVVGTIFVVLLAISFAVPFGFLSGIFINSFASKSVKEFFSFSYELLAATPSIVIGLFGLSVTIFIYKNFYDKLFPSLLVSAICLAILIMPYIVQMTQNALESVPKYIKSSALNLGASKQQNLFLVELPYASKHLLSGVILAIGRAVEDTAVIMMTGAVAMAGIPSSILQKYEALPFFIYYISSEYQNLEELNKGFGASVILLFVSVILFIMVSILRKVALKKGQV